MLRVVQIYEDQCADLIPTPCDEKTWVDNINHCGECKVLVDNFDTKYGGLCENFCRAQGLDCAGVRASQMSSPAFELLYSLWT